METFLKSIGTIALIFVLALILNYPLMWAVNYLFASSFLLAVFGVAELTFWKTYVLSVVLGWLFNRGK